MTFCFTSDICVSPIYCDSANTEIPTHQILMMNTIFFLRHSYTNISADYMIMYIIYDTIDYIGQLLQNNCLNSSKSANTEFGFYPIRQISKIVFLAV